MQNRVQLFLFLMDDIHYKYVGVKLQVVISFPDIIIGVKTEYMDLDYMGSFL